MTIYSKLDQRSKLGIPNSLYLWDLPQTQGGVDANYPREFLTLNPYTSTPYNFRVLSGASFIDLSKTRLVTQWVLERKKKTEPEEKFATFLTEKTAGSVENDDETLDIVNGLGAVFAENVIISVGGQQVFNSNNLYMYHAYLWNELQNGEDAKKSSMNAFGYFYENVFGEKAKERRHQFKNGIAEFSAPIYADFFQSTRFFLSHSEIDIKIYPCKQNMWITNKNAAYDYRVRMTSIRLFMNFIDLHPGVALDVEQMMDSEYAMYPYRRIETKVYFFGDDASESHNNIFPDSIPHDVNIVFVSKDAFNASPSEPAFKFIHSHVRDLRLNAGGRQNPYTPWELDWGVGITARPFEHLHRTVGLIDCGINRSMFENGWTIFPFNMTTSGEEDDGFDFVREGPTMMHARFHTDKTNDKCIPTGGIFAIVIASFDCILYVDKSRQVRTDLTV